MPKVPEGYLNERRRHILAAASRVFSKRGMQAATMTEVANEAGISPGLIYRYFPSKEELISCAMSESTQDLEQRWMEPPVDHPDPLSEFRELSARTFGSIEDPVEQLHTIMHLEHVLSATRDGDSVAMEEARDNFEGIVQKIAQRFEAAQRAGQMSESVDTIAMAQVCVDFYWGTRMRKLILPELDIQPAFRAFTRMLEDAWQAGEERSEVAK